MAPTLAQDRHAGHGHDQDAVRRWASLEGWWVVAGIIALLVILALRLVFIA